MGSEPHPPPRFFVLHSERRTRYDTEFSIIHETESGPAPQCPRCGGVVGMLTWRPPHRVELQLHGEESGDFVQFLGVGPYIIVSERFADAFSAAGFKGLQGFEPVEVAKVRRQRRRTKTDFTLPRYFTVAVPFGSALVDEARSQILRRGPFTCDYCRADGTDGYNGFVLEPGSWNGDDIFEPRGLAVCVVSERFANLVSKYALTNIVLTPTERHVWDPLRRFTQPASS